MSGSNIYPVPDGKTNDAENGGLAPSKSNLKMSLSKANFLVSGMPVTFKGMSCQVINSKNKKEKLTILDGISGYFKSGEMAALMGPSGSGKTTLLDILAGRKTVGDLTGEIKFGGEVPTSMFLRRYTGYVEQFDTLVDILTVEEMLMYTAELKRPINQPKAQKKAAVDELLHVLALEGCRDVRIGSSLNRGISGGQAKRVNIGIALVTNPRVLFLDEPTSGLDSFTANEVMSVVKSLADHGLTVCATVHSPTPYTFYLFDRLLLLLHGKVAYFGENGAKAIEYFHSIAPSDVEGLKEGENESEWIVNMTTNADRQGKSHIFTDAFDKSEARVLGDKEIEDQLHLSSTLDEETKKNLAVRRETVTPFWWALKTLLKYRTLKNWRDPVFLGPRIGDKLLFSFIIFSLFWSIGDELVPGNLPNISSALFIWQLLPAFGAASYIPAIVLERPLFVRERNDGLYRVITLLCSKMIEELVIAFFMSIIFSNWVFWSLKLQGAWVLFWIVYFMNLAIGIVLAYFIGALSPTMDIANTALPAYVVTCLFFAGLLITFDSMPKWWKWFSYLDFLKYAWGALMKNQFGGDRNVPFIVDPTTNTTINILNYFGLAGISAWGWFGIQFGFFVAFFTLAFLALTYVKHIKR